MEDPGYPAAVVAFNAAGAHLNYVPVDTKGLDVSFAQRHFPGAEHSLLLNHGVAQITALARKTSPVSGPN
jgi:hypothetical protein